EGGVGLLERADLPFLHRHVAPHAARVAANLQAVVELAAAALPRPHGDLLAIAGLRIADAQLAALAAIVHEELELALPAGGRLEDADRALGQHHEGLHG